MNLIRALRTAVKYLMDTEFEDWIDWLMRHNKLKPEERDEVDAVEKLREVFPAGRMLELAVDTAGEHPGAAAYLLEYMMNEIYELPSNPAALVLLGAHSREAIGNVLIKAGEHIKDSSAESSAFSDFPQTNAYISFAQDTKDGR